MAGSKKLGVVPPTTQLYRLARRYIGPEGSFDAGDLHYFAEGKAPSTAVPVSESALQETDAMPPDELNDDDD